MASEESLQNVLSRMVHKSSLIPSRDLLMNGVPREYHEMFYDRCHKRTREYQWMRPRVRLDEKQRWLDRPDPTPICSQVTNACVLVFIRWSPYWPSSPTSFLPSFETSCQTSYGSSCLSLEYSLLAVGRATQLVRLLLTLVISKLSGQVSCPCNAGLRLH